MLALGLSAPSESMNALQGACVNTFGRFATPVPGFVARRCRLPRSVYTYLRRDGAYTSEFRFQMLLTVRIPNNALRQKLKSELQALFAEHLMPGHVIDGIAVSVQPEPGRPFTVLERFEFSPCAQRPTLV